MTASAINRSLARRHGMKAVQVKAILDDLMEIAATQLKKHGSFKIGGYRGCLSIRSKKMPATPTRKGVSPFARQPCVFKAKPELTEMVNDSTAGAVGEDDAEEERGDEENAVSDNEEMQRKKGTMRGMRSAKTMQKKNGAKARPRKKGAMRRMKRDE